MEYDIARRYSDNLSFPNYYVNERHMPLTYSQHARADPRGYPIGGPVGRPPGRPGVGSDEPTMETGPARRRIAVACARCRKRKIRCSGDPGNGAGCTNCRQAGVDASGCQFHRVGSDHVHKVIDTFHMANSLTGLANSNGIMPIYPAPTNNQMYGRRTANQTYPQIDTRTIYSSAWTLPYPEDTLPVDQYSLDQAAAYLPTPAPMTSNTVYGSLYRWAHPTSKHLHHGSNTYYDQESSYPTHGLPYVLPNNTRTSTASEALSPLNMSSLSLTLPERLHPRQYNMTNGTAPPRQLPMPQPSLAQTSRNVVDQLQDQRLRSRQVVNTSSPGGGATFAKPLLPWTTGSNSHENASAAAATSSGVSSQLPTTVDGTLNFMATTTAGDTNASGATSKIQLNFTSSSLLDAMSAPAPVTTYSTFREHRPQATQPHPTRHSSQSSLYSFSPDDTSKRNSFENDNDCKLVNDHSYTSLSHQPQQASSSAESLRRDSFENHNVPFHRSSMGDLNSAY